LNHHLAAFGSIVWLHRACKSFHSVLAKWLHWELGPPFGTKCQESQASSGRESSDPAWFQSRQDSINVSPPHISKQFPVKLMRRGLYGRDPDGSFSEWPTILPERC